MKFLYFLAHIFKKNKTFATSADIHILQLVCDLKRSKFNLIKNTNKKQSYVR